MKKCPKFEISFRTYLNRGRSKKKCISFTAAEVNVNNVFGLILDRAT